MAYEPTLSQDSGQKKNRTPIIIAVVVAILLCCCCLFLALAWNYGDYVVDFINDLSALPRLAGVWM